MAQKKLRQKEKLLVISSFFFCFNVFPINFYVGRQNQVLFGNGLNPLSVSTYCKPLVTYLGHVIEEEGVATDPAKTEAIKSLPTPSNIPELRSFLDFAGGGAELLFGNVKKHEVNLPEKQEWTLKDLLVWIKDNMLKERPELFMQGDTVRPGILVLVNDADWELLGELEYVVQPKDRIVFISTLHGG